ncbi:hypothetical protein [Heyndrickxia ginsengihumi]|uniref:hypothetical protein n=1 Tax=Heyndrickxia ginsengihumi TaxID=363870 RepID=UPI003D1B4F3D
MTQNLMDFMNDPIIYTLSFMFLTVGLIYLSRLIGKPSSYVSAKTTTILVDHKIQKKPTCDSSNHSVIIWILTCVRRKECPNDADDHHISLHAHYVFN